MFGYALVCGWGITTAVTAVVWIGGKPGRTLVIGLLIGLLAGLLWPITLWIALGAGLHDRAARRPGPATGSPDVLDAQAREAQAFARQAELENMPSSAEYWRAEAARLTAQRHTAVAPPARPASTPLIVFGATAASLVTLGVLALAAPPLPAPGVTASSPAVTAAPAETPTIAAPVAAPPSPTPSGRYTYRIDGNYRATGVSYTASNGDSVMLNNTGDITTMGTAPPWTLTVDAEPNGGSDNLTASTMSPKGDSWITCTILDDAGTVVQTQTGRGAYASCSASTPSPVS